LKQTIRGACRSALRCAPRLRQYEARRSGVGVHLGRIRDPGGFRRLLHFLSQSERADGDLRFHQLHDIVGVGERVVEGRVFLGQKDRFVVVSLRVEIGEVRQRAQAAAAGAEEAEPSPVGRPPREALRTVAARGVELAVPHRPQVERIQVGAFLVDGIRCPIRQDVQDVPAVRRWAREGAGLAGLREFHDRFRRAPDIGGDIVRDAHQVETKRIQILRGPERLIFAADVIDVLSVGRPARVRLDIRIVENLRACADRVSLDAVDDQVAPFLDRLELK
jgi:hypothetical protein